jgi:AcrR family transcriptional regulator
MHSLSPPGRALTNARGRRTRAALLAAARSVLEERGFPALTMGAVADRAGVTRRSVYLHFASRTELVGALFEAVAETEGLQSSLQRVRAAPDAVSALDAWARHEATYHVGILRVASALEHVGRDDPDAAAWRQRIAEHQLIDCRFLAERLAGEHCLARGWTVERATDMLWALISTEPLERLLIDRGWQPETYAELFAQLLRSTFVARSGTWASGRVASPRQDTRGQDREEEGGDQSDRDR